MSKDKNKITDTLSAISRSIISIWIIYNSFDVVLNNTILWKRVFAGIGGTIFLVFLIIECYCLLKKKVNNNNTTI